jgi:hypothetical protein
MYGMCLYVSLCVSMCLYTAGVAHAASAIIPPRHLGAPSALSPTVQRIKSLVFSFRSRVVDRLVILRRGSCQGMAHVLTFEAGLTLGRPSVLGGVSLGTGRES